MTTTKPDRSPRFTVIIPTKDRADYVHHTLRTCSLQDYENLEILVSDDGSADNTRDVVTEAARKDPRIRYFSPGAGVGMLDNFEYALRQARPGYVIALGGDDGLLPYGITGMLAVLQETGQELLAWPAPAYFYAKTKMETAQLILHTRGWRLQGGTKIIPSKEFLERQARRLSYVNDIEAPMFYVKGVTSTRLVERVRGRTSDGRFFACATPDGFSGIVLAGEVDSYAFSGRPFSIHGVSPTSAGVNYLGGDERAKKQSDSFFRHASQRPMHADLAGQPYSPLITLMSADYLLTARDLPGWPGTFPAIDMRALLLKSLNELADGLYADHRVVRELPILSRIADHHGMGEFFRRRVRTARRNRKKTLEGNAVSPCRLYLDATQYGINNVFDAAYVAHYMHEIVPKLTLSTAWSFMRNSLAYRIRGLPMGARFPAEHEWQIDQGLPSDGNASQH